LIDGTFPDYQRVIPQENKNKLEVLEGTFKRECQDYPTKEDCLVCCN